MSANSFPFDHLVVIHYHWRPGGVRRVVELTLPAIATAAHDALRKITILGGGQDGEAPDLHGIQQPVAIINEPACDYFCGNESDVDETATRIRQSLHRAIADKDATRTLIWFQNPALARNAILCREIANFTRLNGAAILLHHHDFWCAGRWARWKELLQCGCIDLSNAAEILFAAGTRSAHIGINLRDFKTLQNCLSGAAFYLPNPVQLPIEPERARIEAARIWVQNELPHPAPFWIYPTRFLRRKNLLEAVLLTRWLRPDAVLATTSGKFSADESGYASTILKAASDGKWRAHFGLLDKPGAPRVEEILHLAETVIHTSMQEGFGMTFVESAATGTPLIARRISGVMPDLTGMGFSFPQLYNDIQIAPSLFNVDTEIGRLCALFENAEKQLPKPFRNLFPHLVPNPKGPFVFSRLTLQAQTEILENSAERIRSACAPLNPEIEKIRNESLKPTPRSARSPHTPKRYAEEFLRIASRLSHEQRTDRDNAAKAQLEIATTALSIDSIFPLQLQ